MEEEGAVKLRGQGRVFLPGGVLKPMAPRALSREVMPETYGHLGALGEALYGPALPIFLIPLFVYS